MHLSWNRMAIVNTYTSTHDGQYNNIREQDNYFTIADPFTSSNPEDQDIMNQNLDMVLADYSAAIGAGKSSILMVKQLCACN